MKPYYERDGITIYHGDCREILPRLEFAEVMVTDPPYGIGHASGFDSSWTGTAIEGDESTDLRDGVLECWGERPAIVFGSWKQPRPRRRVRAVLAWDKGPASGMGDLSFPWKGSWEEVYVMGDGFEGRRDEGVLRYGVVTWESKGRSHPNAKPVELMQHLISKCPGGLIVDPFMGSGTTLVAAKLEGRCAIGIEIEERYCEIAAKRLAQGVLSFDVTPS